MKVFAVLKYLFCGILLPLVNISCDSNHNAVNLLGTHWVSDSVFNGDQKQNEYLFFDSLGRFTRASWHTKRYIIDQGKLGRDDKIHGGKQLYEIHQLDSNYLLISSSQYKVSFKRSITDQQYLMSKFLLGSSNKIRMIGEWLVDSIVVDCNNMNGKSKSAIHWAKENAIKISNQFELFEGSRVEITQENEFIVKSDKEQRRYRCKIVGNNLEIRVSDYIINLPLSLKKNNYFVLERNTGLCVAKFVFIKK